MYMLSNSSQFRMLYGKYVQLWSNYDPSSVILKDNWFTSLDYQDKILIVIGCLDKQEDRKRHTIARNAAMSLTRLINWSFQHCFIILCVTFNMFTAGNAHRDLSHIVLKIHFICRRRKPMCQYKFNKYNYTHTYMSNLLIVSQSKTL